MMADATNDTHVPAKFCRIVEPNNSDFDERFACVECGENFITMCSYARLKLQLKNAAALKLLLQEALDLWDSPDRPVTSAENMAVWRKRVRVLLHPDEAAVEVRS